MVLYVFVNCRPVASLKFTAAVSVGSPRPKISRYGTRFQIARQRKPFREFNFSHVAPHDSSCLWSAPALPSSAEKDQRVGRSLWMVQRYGIFASRQNLRHDLVGGFWLLCRALFLLHTALQFVFEVTLSSRQIRLSKRVRSLQRARTRPPHICTQLLEALTRNRGSNLHRCKTSAAIATASSFKCDRSRTRTILLS